MGISPSDIDNLCDGGVAGFLPVGVFRWQDLTDVTPILQKGLDVKRQNLILNHEQLK